MPPPVQEETSKQPLTSLMGQLFVRELITLYPKIQQPMKWIRIIVLFTWLGALKCLSYITTNLDCFLLIPSLFFFLKKKNRFPASFCLLICSMVLILLINVFSLFYTVKLKAKHKQLRFVLHLCCLMSKFPF